MTPRTELFLNGREYKIARVLRTSDENSQVMQAYDQLGRARNLAILAPEIEANRSEQEWLAERMFYAAALENVQQFARFDDAAVAGGGDDPRIIAWVEDAVWGVPLTELLSRRADGMTVSRVKRIAADLGAALSALRAVSASYRNLTSCNIVLHEPDSISGSTLSAFKITDLWKVQRQSEDEASLVQGDVDIVNILVDCHRALVQTRSLSAAATRFCDNLADFLSNLAEDIGSGRLIDGSALGELVDGCDSVRRSVGSPPLLRNPFDYISAEHFADDDLLVDIFADSCPWLEEVVQPNPNLIVGPRGCGKSTILRWLSIKAHLGRHDDHFDKYGLAAFFTSCTGEMQTRLGHIQTLDEAQSGRHVIVHYFNLLVALEVVETLVEMACQPEADRDNWGLTADAQVSLHRYFAGQLGAENALLAGVPPLQQVLDMVEQELEHAKYLISNNEEVVELTGESFLTELSRMLTREISFFQQRQIAFCLDDYSVHRVPAPVQKVLNRVVFGVRTSTHIFKISAEKYGFVSQDEYGARLDMERELVLVDCGEEFVSLGDGPNHTRARQFARDLLANRLRQAGYVGTPEMLIGHTGRSNRDFALALRNRKDRTADAEPVDTRYYGLECIADLCSGDVATLLLVYRKIFDDGAVRPDQTRQIEVSVQHNAIRHVSRQMLQSVRTHHPYGPVLISIVEQFGSLVRYALEQGPTVRSRGSGHEPEPMQYPRIEIDGAAGVDAISWNSDDESLAEVAQELVRRSVFIELTPGNARRGRIADGKTVRAGTVSERLQIRRIFLPSFQVSLGKNGAWKWTVDQFEEFLRDPVRFCRDERQKLNRRANISRPDDELSLFGRESNEASP